MPRKGPAQRRELMPDPIYRSVLVTQIVNNCEKGDLACRRRQRQAVLHWAYDSRTI